MTAVQTLFAAEGLTIRQGGPVVVLGAPGSGGEAIAGIVQQLGVDMIDAAGDESRHAISALNDQLLALIGRPFGGRFHGLPASAGWWNDTRLAVVKEELRATLSRLRRDDTRLWGLFDPRITRLLPLWQQLFEELGFRPTYIWAICDPAIACPELVRSEVAETLPLAETVWFVYNADIIKLAGDEIAAVIDHAELVAKPAETAEQLLDLLQLKWRGSRAELIECARSQAPRTVPDATKAELPLASGLFDTLGRAAVVIGSSAEREILVRALDLMRGFVDPFAELVEGKGEGEDAGRQIEALRLEAEARTHEAIWLQRQSGEHKQALAQAEEDLRVTNAENAEQQLQLELAVEGGQAEIRATQRRVGDIQAAADRTQQEMRREADKLRREADTLRRDLAHERAATARYLSRIYELKALQRAAEQVPGRPEKRPA